MKQHTMLMAASLLLLGACKNDRGDDTHLDTTTATTQALPDNTKAVTATDSGVPKADSVTTAATPGSGASGSTVAATPPKSTAKPIAKTEKQPSLDNRFKKTSRKGRILIASLMNNSADKIEADKEGIYNRAEVMPAYPGGEDALRKYIENHIEYPQPALDNSVEGTVKVSFAVDERGKIYTPAVVSSKLGYGLEDEALRVVKQMPNWAPGQVKGKNVKTRFTLPITYKIE